MAIQFYSPINLNQNDVEQLIPHKLSSAPSSPSPVSGQMYYNTSANTLHYHNGSGWQTVGTSSGSMTSFQLEDDDGTEVAIADAKEVKFVGSGITTNWTDTDNGTDGDPYDLTFTVDAAQTGITSVLNTSLTVGRDAHNQIDFSTDNEIHFKTNNETPVIKMKASGEIEATKFDGALEGNADTATLAVTATHVTVTSNTSTDENNRVPFIEDTSASGNVGLESDNTFYYNPSSGALAATVFNGEWQGTAIASAYLDADTAHLTTAQTFTGSKTFGTTTKLNFRDGNSYIYSPTANDIEVVGTTITLDAGSDIQLEGNTTVTGNLTISGTTTTVNTATLTVEDPLIKLASGNDSGDAVDIGFYGLYDNSGSQDVYTGLTRDASDDKWHLWKLNQAEPTTTVNHSGTGFAVDTLVANLEGNVTGNVTGDTSGSAGTVTSIGNLTGDVTSSNRATTIANDTVTLAKMAPSAIGVSATIAVGSITTNKRVQIAHGLSTQNIRVEMWDVVTFRTVYADVLRAEDDLTTTSDDYITIDFGETTPPNNIEVLMTSLDGATDIAAGGSIVYT